MPPRSLWAGSKVRRQIMRVPGTTSRTSRAWWRGLSRPEPRVPVGESMGILAGVYEQLADRFVVPPATTRADKTQAAVGTVPSSQAAMYEHFQSI